MSCRIAAAMSLLAVAACPAPANEEPAPTTARSSGDDDGVPDFTQAFKSRIRFDPGEQTIVADLDIAPGFHAYTIGEATGRPLALKLDPTSAVEHAGDVKYPKGKAKTLPIGPSVIVEGKAHIVAPVKRREGAETPEAKGTLHYQICTDEICDRPRKKAFQVKTQPPPGP